MTDNVVAVEKTERAVDELAAIYPLLAKNFLEISGSHVLFSTLKPVGLDKLQALMPESDRQYWQCSCCGYLFGKVMNTVYFDIEENAFDSAYLPLGLIETLEVSDQWKSYFRDLRTLILSSPAGSLYAPAAVEGVNADNKRFKRLAKEENLDAVRAKFGRPEAGGYHHFYAEYLTSNPTTQLGIQWKQTIASIETLVGGRSLEYMAREARVFGELVETNKDGRFLKQMTGLAAMLDCLHKYTVPGYHMLPYMKMLATVSVDEDVARGWGVMASFNGSALGTAFREGIASGDWAAAKETFEKMIDPVKYRAKEVAKVTEEQLIRAKKALESEGVVSALVRRYATIGDLDGAQSIWKRPVTVEEAKTKDPFALSLERVKGEEKQIISANEIKDISWGTFMDTILPEYSDIEIYVAGRGAYFNFTVPVDPEAKPILMWDSEECRVPWCTMVARDPTYPQRHGLQDSKWYPLEQVVKAPMGDYYFVAVQSESVEQDRAGCSFGQVLAKHLYEHRGPIDHVLTTVGLDSVKNPLIGIRQGNAGCRKLHVRGVRNGVLKTFVVINLG